MKKTVFAALAASMLAGAAYADGHGERYVMITHTQGTDPFWPVVEKGGRDAAEAIGATLEYNFDVSGAMAATRKAQRSLLRQTDRSSSVIQVRRRQGAKRIAGLRMRVFSA